MKSAPSWRLSRSINKLSIMFGSPLSTASMKNCIRPYIYIIVVKMIGDMNEYKLTVHIVKSDFETSRGFSVTPSSAVGP